jgi:hypothetical protein
MTEKRRVIYIAHPLGDGPERVLNIGRASKWVAWAANQGVAPVCTWVVLASQWDEKRREEGLAIDCRLIDVCDEVWLCGPRISPGMHVEASHAAKDGVPTHVLVDPAFTEGPPLGTTFEDLVMRKPGDKVRAMVEEMAAHHGMGYEAFRKLSALQVVALEHANPFKRKAGPAAIQEFQRAWEETAPTPPGAVGENVGGKTLEALKAAEEGKS